MNEILAKFEEMDINDLTMIFEYLVDLINYKKEQKRLSKKLLKQKENLTTNSQVKPINAQSVDTRQ